MGLFSSPLFVIRMSFELDSISEEHNTFLMLDKIHLGRVAHKQMKRLSRVQIREVAKSKILERTYKSKTMFYSG